jgi:glycogen phosphorylase
MEDDRTGSSVATLRRALADNLFYVQGTFPEIAMVSAMNSVSLARSFTMAGR